MITQILIPTLNYENKYTDLWEDFTFSGKFPSKKDLINHLKSLVSEYSDMKRIYSQCLKTIRAIKPKHWPILNKDMSITTPGSVKFEKDIKIMYMMDSPFNKNIGITIVWKILTPCNLN